MQDERYDGKRVMNCLEKTKDKDHYKEARCTVCGRDTVVHRDEPKKKQEEGDTKTSKKQAIQKELEASRLRKETAKASSKTGAKANAKPAAKKKKK